MWAINNQTPFEAERTWVRDKNGAEVWLVAVKGTFSIQNEGKITIAEEQEPVNIAHVYCGEPGNSSLLSDTDLPHLKKNTDVFVEGQAWAPEGRPVETLEVSLKLANIHKTLQVTGDRLYNNGLTGIKLGKPKSFVSMPIIYENAFGGTDQVSENPKHHGWEPRNPLGTGFAMKKEHLIDKLAPNIEYPNALVSQWVKKPSPAGFGPIAGHWSPRVELAGTYDKNWEETRQPLLAEDFDERYYQSAPEDQQTNGFLKGGEFVELHNLTPSGRLSFHLPRFVFGFTTNFDDGTRELHRADLHTVTIKPDESKVVMVWHTHLECHHKVLKLNSTTVRIKTRKMLSGTAKAQEVVA